MWISNIKIKNFRNYTDEKIELNKNINVFYGENAQGKTNIIEAIYLTAMGKSYRTKKESEMINFNSQNSLIEVEYFKSFLRTEFNVKFLDKSFYNSIDYLNNVNNVDFNWTSALPIFSPPTLVRKAGSSSFLLDDLHHYSPYNGHSELRKAIRKKFKKDGINAEEKNIIINTSIFEILEGFYSSLNWKNNDSILIPTPTSRNI